MGAIIGWIIFGLIAGAIAKLLMPGRDPGGFTRDHPAWYRRRGGRRIHWPRSVG
jgi:hypothetical protein